MASNFHRQRRKPPPKGSTLLLEHKGLDHNDLHHILTLLNTPREYRRPHQTRRHDDLFAQIDQLTSSSNIWKMSFVGNKGIGDKGIEHLHMIPASVRVLDFSDCNLSPSGIQNICKFLEGNTSITRMILWGNRVNDEAARAVGEMLKQNDTLEELVIDQAVNSGDTVASNDLTCRAVGWICKGLKSNRTLRHLGFSPGTTRISCQFDAWFAHLLPSDSSVEALDTRKFVYFINSSNDKEADELWLNRLQKNQKLTFLGAPEGRRSIDVRFFLKLNSVHARRILADNTTSVEYWLAAVSAANKQNWHDVVFYLLRNKPEYFVLELGRRRKSTTMKDT